MTRRRFYALPEDIHDRTVTLSADETHHLIHVLRMTPGNQAFVFDGCGREYRCTFRAVANNRAQLDIDEEIHEPVESPIDLTLAQALAKGDKFEFIVQKATELGVKRIVPLATRYADVKIADDQIAKKLDRWRRISLEALKQCGRRLLVEIAPPRMLGEFLETASSHPATLLLFSERGGRSVTDALVETPRQCPVVAIVGPEGGWSEDEFELFEQRGAKSVTLGPRTLRTETAAIVAITLIQHAMGDIGAR